MTDARVRDEFFEIGLSERAERAVHDARSAETDDCARGPTRSFRQDAVVESEHSVDADLDRDGRIGALDTVFYDTLLDENAASHLALGRGFAFLIEDEETRSRVNESDIHIDFMIGRPDLTVTGITTDGDRVPVLVDGAWQI